MNRELEAQLKSIKLTDVQSLDELWEFQRWLGERRKILGVDIETGGLSFNDRIRTCQFGDSRQGFCLAYEDWRGAIAETLARYEGPLVGHNIKFDYGRLSHNGIKVPWARSHDTMFMCHLNDSLGPKSLKPAARLHIGPLAGAGQNALKKRMAENKWTWNTIPVHDPLYTGYGMIDTCITAMLAEELWPKVQYAREAYDLEMAVSRVLSDMELRGLRVDLDYVRSLRTELLDEIDSLERELGGVNFNASGQILAALMEQGAVFTKRTEKGQLSTDDEVMSDMEEQGFAMAGLIRTARGDYKVVNSYIKNWLNEEMDGFLHPSINQIAARTSRMSVTNPAMQTLHKSKRVRRSFIPRDGNSLVLIDYMNQEVRLAGHFSGDEAIIKAFAEGRDLHSETAKRIYGTEECSHDSHLKCKHRSVGKTGFLGKLYGSGVNTFADTVGMSKAQATEIHSALAQLYPGLEKTMARVTTAVQQRGRDSGGNGYVVTVDGRHIMIPANQGYKGLNGLIQGSAATILKRAIIDIDLAGYGETMLLPVHDELVFDVPKQDLDDVVPELSRIMTRNDFRIPLTVDPTVVSDWGVPYE
jgi:DNA polymerase I